MKKHCAVCGTEFVTSRQTSRFCSNQCYGKSLSGVHESRVCPCGNTFTVIVTSGQKHCSRRCAWNTSIGTRHPSRTPKVGRYVALRRNGRSDWEHREIAEKALGKALPPKANVHHWDNNGRNNAYGNLVICQDAAYHRLLHRRAKLRALGCNPNTESWCSNCRRALPLELFWFRNTGTRRPLCWCKKCFGRRTARIGSSTGRNRL